LNDFNVEIIFTNYISLNVHTQKLTEYFTNNLLTKNKYTNVDSNILSLNNKWLSRFEIIHRHIKWTLWANGKERNYNIIYEISLWSGQIIQAGYVIYFGISTHIEHLVYLGGVQCFYPHMQVSVSRW